MDYASVEQHMNTPAPLSTDDKANAALKGVQTLAAHLGADLTSASPVLARIAALEKQVSALVEDISAVEKAPPEKTDIFHGLSETVYHALARAGILDEKVQQSPSSGKGALVDPRSGVPSVGTRAEILNRK